MNLRYSAALPSSMRRWLNGPSSAMSERVSAHRQRIRDVAGLAMLVPLFQAGDDFADDIVEHGTRNLVFVLEIVVEKRCGHADPFGDIADRDFRKPFSKRISRAACTIRRATRVSNGAGGRFRFPGHGSLLPIAWQRLVRHGGSARVLGAQQSAFVTDGTPIARFMSDFQSTGCAGCKDQRQKNIFWQNCPMPMSQS